MTTPTVISARSARKANDAEYVFDIQSSKGANIKNVDNDTVALEGNLADYNVKATGAGVLVTSKTDKQFKLNITLQKANEKKDIDAGVLKLVFADGSLDLTRDGKSIELLDGTELSKKAKALTDLSGKLDPSVTYDDVIVEEPGEGETPVEGQTFTLTAGVDTIAGTTNVDTIEGVSSALSSARTLDAGDKIDGGEGADVLKVDLQSNFAGFTGEGFLKNVETVELTNSGAIARSFSAKGAEGVQGYVLNGDVSLSDLAATTAAITLNGQQKDFTVGFADKVTDGTADALTLNLNGVGTAENEATTATEEVRVNLTAAGIEEVKLGVAGVNVVNVTAAAAKSVIAAGEGSLDLELTGSTAVTTIDASAVAGSVNVVLDNLTAVTSVATGAGDDKITTGGELAINATVAGGAGADVLELEGLNTTTQYTMSGVETVALEDNTTLTFSAKNVTGLTTIAANNTFDGTATFANLGAANLAFALKETSAGTITADNSGAATVTVAPSKDAKLGAEETNTTNLNLTNASSVDLSVAKFAYYQGDITALKATSLEAKIDGQINNQINLAVATAAVINATNKDVSNVVLLQASKLVDLNITTAGDFDVDTAGTQDLGKLEALTVATSGDFSVDAMAAVNSVKLSGTGAASLGALGGAALEYGVNVTASGLNALTIADINVGVGQSINLNIADVAGAVALTGATVAQDAGKETGSITVNANGTQGNVDLGDLQAKSVTVNAAGALGTVAVAVTADTASVTGSELKANDIVVSASKSATVVGGIADDTIEVIGTAAEDASAVFTVTGGLGGDLFYISENGAGSTKVTISDFRVAEDDFLEVAGDFSLVEANAAATDGSLALVLSNAASTLDNVLAAAYASEANSVFTFGGNTYVAVADGTAGFGDNDIQIVLTGVTGASLADLGLTAAV